MRYVGVDLHKRLVVACVVEVIEGRRTVVARGKWSNQEPGRIVEFLRSHAPLQVVVEATACYDWFVSLAEGVADRVVLAHPRKLRVIAESTRKREARAVLATMPGVGTVTTEAILCELGDVRRFRSQKQVTAYAGLAPGIRQSAGRTKQQGITKEGSRLLRWALVELAWRMVRATRRWGLVYERLKQRRGAKRAIVAVARRLLGVMVAMLRSGKRYSLATEALV